MTTDLLSTHTSLGSEPHMAIQRFESRALANLTSMAPGRYDWNRYSNDLWHWFKHAAPLIQNGKALTRPDISNVANPDQYLFIARDICRRIVAGDPAGAVKLREQARGDLVVRDYLVWFHPPGMMRGLFLVIHDRGDHGELETMFTPADGRSYFDDQPGEPLWGSGAQSH